jgi:osmotically-inducible protein OsmY
MSSEDLELIEAVRAQLVADERLQSPGEIAIDAFQGKVTLRGTVGSFSQERSAVHDAHRTRGVVDVFDKLEVRILDEDRRADAEIRGAALQRLIWDPQLIADDLDVSVKEGWVTLTGNVSHQFQSDIAFERVASLRSVTGITNKIQVFTAL